MKSLMSHLAGYSVIGRHGPLGTVVDVETMLGDGGESIVFRGGVSDALQYHVPAALVRSISPHRRTLVLDVDVGDFVPRLGNDGTVELHLNR
jgi:hypothetical protein